MPISRIFIHIEIFPALGEVLQIFTYSDLLFIGSLSKVKISQTGHKTIYTYNAETTTRSKCISSDLDPVTRKLVKLNRQLVSYYHYINVKVNDRLIIS